MLTFAKIGFTRPRPARRFVRAWHPLTAYFVRWCIGSARPPSGRFRYGPPTPPPLGRLPWGGVRLGGGWWWPWPLRALASGGRTYSRPPWPLRAAGGAGGGVRLCSLGAPLRAASLGLPASSSGGALRGPWRASLRGVLGPWRASGGGVLPCGPYGPPWTPPAVAGGVRPSSRRCGWWWRSLGPPYSRGHRWRGRGGAF